MGVLLVSVAAVNTTVKCNLERKGFILVYRLYSIMNRSQDRYLRQEVKWRPWRSTA